MNIFTVAGIAIFIQLLTALVVLIYKAPSSDAKSIFMEGFRDSYQWVFEEQDSAVRKLLIKRNNKIIWSEDEKTDFD